jgi:hypothetical protein
MRNNTPDTKPRHLVTDVHSSSIFFLLLALLLLATTAAISISVLVVVGPGAFFLQQAEHRILLSDIF